MNKLYILLLAVICTACNNSGTEQQPESKSSLLIDCKKIEKYPCLFSYRTDGLRSVLLAKAIKPLTVPEKQNHFNEDAFNNTDATKQLLYEGKYEVFPLNKIMYSKSILAVYLIKEISGESNFENDIFSLVIYNNEGKQADILNINLLNSFGSKEVNMTSLDEFEVLWIDSEYSPDPESEAEDIKNGDEPGAVLITTIYKIDTVALKFVEQKRWQEDFRENEKVKESGSLNTWCFECTYPGGNKHIVFREYIQLRNDNGQITGKGAGHSEGDPEWSFTFSGTLTNDTVLELKAKYKQDGISPFSASETWFVNMEKGSIRLKERVPVDLRAISNGEYHKVDCNVIPEELRDLTK